MEDVVGLFDALSNPHVAPRSRRRAVISIVTAAVVAALPGCGSDSAPADGTATAESGPAEGSSSAPAEESDGTGDSTAATEPPSDGSATGAPAPGLAPASGVAILSVDANQGVAVPIGRDGTGVPGDERKNRLLGGRPMQIRAVAALEPSFTPRTVEAHLLLTYPDDTKERVVSTRAMPGDETIVDGVSTEGFTWLLEGKRVVPGMRYAIELYEHDVVADANDAAPPYYPPLDGVPIAVGVEAVNQRIAVTLVPVRYDNGHGCATEVEISDASASYLEHMLYMQHPVTEVEFTVREPLSVSTELFDLATLLNLVSQQRALDGASTETYYFGWIEDCEGTVLDSTGLGGLAPVPTEFTPETAYLRVAVGKWGPGLEHLGDTLVHELGHAQGRKHAICRGDEANPDLSYPIAGGELDVAGFGVIDGITRDVASYADMMSYCQPRWTSAYGWTLVEPVIRELSSWSMQDAVGSADASAVLIGTLTGAGVTHWMTLPGKPPRARADAATHAISFAYPDGRVDEVTATVVDLGDSDAKWLVAPLPDDFALATDLAHHHQGRVARIEPTAVHQIHLRSPR